MKISNDKLSLFFLLCASVSLWLILPLHANAQVRPIYDRGATGLAQMLKRLNTTASALMIGAHPDDEDTALLAYLARGESARTAYLSLTRGDGGQNIIGPELGEALGIIRTEELLQARRLDGAEQFFTRAYDYGFSKTLAEAKQKWDEKIILCDTVRVIRNFRPLVVISQFTGTPADGHGQHQFAGYITPLAIKAAADSSQCTDAGPAWKVQKFYVRHGFRATGEPKLKINTGKYDPLLGRSYFEIAMEARSQHKSQEQGVLELKGDQFSGLNLVESSTPTVEQETSIFDGIDKTFKNLLWYDPKDVLAKGQLAAQRALSESWQDDPARIVPHLIEGYKWLGEAIGLSGHPVCNSEDIRCMRDLYLRRQPLFRKQGEFQEAILKASGVQIDALSDVAATVPGEPFLVGVKVFLPNKGAMTVKEIEPVDAARWAVVNEEQPKTPSPAFVSRESATASAFFKVSAPNDWQLTQPYWLNDPRDGDMFAWNRDAASHTLPIQPYVPRVAVTIDIQGINLVVERPVEFRYADDIRGEIRRNVNVVPGVSIELDQSLMIVPYSDKPQTRKVVMTVTNHSQKTVRGIVGLNFDARWEWRYSASSMTFDIKRTGEKAAITLEIDIPAKTKPGSYRIWGNAMIGEGLATQTMHTVAYPHIQTHRFYRRAEVNVKVIDLKTAPVKVGYIAGSGDRVPDAIRQMGFELETITERELASGDLSRFDCVVVGIRAYQVRPDVVAANTRLLDYARGGGTLIVQYQLPGYVQQGLTPFPTQIGPRVADENAAVKMLVPDHAVFNFPNKITSEDFMGWVQERNLYNFTNFGAEYTGLLESHDLGEAGNSGGLVIAKLGKGNYVYCSYSMFRQLPAGVPGAYRLFANLLSLGQNRLR